MTEKTLPLWPQSRTNRRSFSFDETVKRTFDILISFLGLIVLSPLFAILAIEIKYSSPGPVFYRGKRLGRYGREFGILKFRTMYEKTSTYQGPPITAQDDPRVTNLGRWLRDTKLNELPQLWNVLVGDMSLVGPRPEDPDIARSWPSEARREILAVRPGITSPASVIYRNEEALLHNANVVEDYLRSVVPTKLRFDQLYARNHSFLSDLDVLFWTSLALIPGSLEIKVPENFLFWGPFARIYTRYITWFVADLIVALLSVSSVVVLWRTGGPLNMGFLHATLLALGISLVFSVINSLTGINKIEWSRANPVEAIDLAFTSMFATTLVILASQRLSYFSDLPEGLLALSGVLSLLGFVAVRYRTRLITGVASRWTALRRTNGIGERVLIVGAGEVGQFTTWLLFNGPLSKAFTVVGMVDDDPRKSGLRISGCRVLGDTTKITELVHKHDVGVILFAIERIEPKQRQRMLTACQASRAQIVVIPDVLTNLREEFARQRQATSNGRYIPALILENGSGNGNGNGNGNDIFGEMPADMTNWLESMEMLVDDQDWETLRARLKEMRTSVEANGYQDNREQG